MVTVLVIDLLKTITRTVTLFVANSGCIHSSADFRGSKGCFMAWAKDDSFLEAISDLVSDFF